MKKNKVIKKDSTFEEVANSLFFDKDNNFKVNAFACLVTVVISGICLLAKKLSEDAK